ncbi:hypothetical protein [Morganella morganii]|uniref:hypothetical protein n=1 Tax=Morganella morganii TaxID=582 RepID=UPI001BDB2782|nr:hypothetical protein [Morganella morganii]ELA8730110.1 hypothetical protein [Morganella morganii]ELB1850260.1 hypothetical protein [Morganella morganii]MBT0489335.1 hypothetical protein [Morganella morganii subsp. morganii]MBT0492723.1 hypothetical protein [Morganella morganii subsp. morganii]QWL92006.1 hypothetical protein IZ186_11860 [Morganella morganii subsp. morganii]
MLRIVSAATAFGDRKKIRRKNRKKAEKYTVIRKRGITVNSRKTPGTGAECPDKMPGSICAVISAGYPAHSSTSLSGPFSPDIIFSDQRHDFIISFPAYVPEAFSNHREIPAEFPVFLSAGAAFLYFVFPAPPSAYL